MLLLLLQELPLVKDDLFVFSTAGLHVPLSFWQVKEGTAEGISSEAGPAVKWERERVRVQVAGVAAAADDARLPAESEVQASSS